MLNGTNKKQLAFAYYTIMARENRNMAIYFPESQENIPEGAAWWNIMTRGEIFSCAIIVLLHICRTKFLLIISSRVLYFADEFFLARHYFEQGVMFCRQKKFSRQNITRWQNNILNVVISNEFTLIYFTLNFFCLI